MAESKIDVDLLNPGQVFACLGLIEAVEILLGEVEAIFDWNNNETAATFRIAVAGGEKPTERVMGFLEDAKVVTLMPAHSDHATKWKKTWGDEPMEAPADTPFPYPDPESPARLPVVLRDGAGAEIPVDHWADGTMGVGTKATRITGRDDMKFWAGSGGYPGAAILRDALKLVGGKMRQHADNPFALSADQSSSFRFDWRSDYVPIQIGFSLNKHPQGSFRKKGFPLVEILAAIGMTHARPARTSKLEYRYGVLGGHCPVDTTFLRAALGGGESPIPGWPFRCFVMRLDWPGQEGQARCIAQVVEASTD